MDKKPLILISICAVVLLILCSLSNVVGYQTVQSSQQNLIKERINQRELLFQTIVDIVNNKEIQRIILKSQMIGGIFPASDSPVVTKNQIKQMYFIGLILKKVVGKAKMQSMMGKNQFNNQEMQKEINATIEKDSILYGEIYQLSALKCDCEESNSENESFPIICLSLILIMAVFAFFPLMYLQGVLSKFRNSFPILYLFLYYTIGAPFFIILGCSWFLWNALNCTIGAPG